MVPSRPMTPSCANSRRQCARRSTRAHSSTSLRKSFGAIPQDCPEVAKRKAPDPFMQFRGSETLDICYSHSIVKNCLQFVSVCRSLLQFVPFTPSLKNCRESMGSNLGHGISCHPRRFRGSRWVTANCEQQLMAVWTLYFRGGWGRGNFAKPSPSKLEQRHEKLLRSSSRKLMLFGLVVVVAKEAIGTRVLVARVGRNKSAFGKHFGHREHERLDLVERGSRPRRPRSYKAWTSAVPRIPCAAPCRVIMLQTHLYCISSDGSADARQLQGTHQE